jgi:hypothetical protein
MEEVVTADKEKRAKAISAYADRLRTLMRGDLSNQARDAFETERLALVDLGVRQTDADFADMIAGLKP